MDPRAEKTQTLSDSAAPRPPFSQKGVRAAVERDEDSILELAGNLDLGLQELPEGLNGLIGRVFEIKPDHLAQITGGHGSGEMLSRVRSRHHEIARRVARGDSLTAISRALGYSISYLSTMINHSDAFQVVLEHYHQNRDETFSVVEERMDAIIMDGLDRMHDIVHDELMKPGSQGVSPTWLRDTVLAVGDRRGHSPVRRSEARVEVSHGIDDKILDAVRARTASLEAGGIPITLDGELVDAEAHGEEKDTGAESGILTEKAIP